MRAALKSSRSENLVRHQSVSPRRLRFGHRKPKIACGTEPSALERKKSSATPRFQFSKAVSGPSKSENTVPHELFSPRRSSVSARRLSFGHRKPKISCGTETSALEGKKSSATPECQSSKADARLSMTEKLVPHRVFGPRRSSVTCDTKLLAFESKKSGATRKLRFSGATTGSGVRYLEADPSTGPQGSRPNHRR